MELRSVEELMDLLYACRYDPGLRTAALLRRARPADKELQVAGLVAGIGRLLVPGAGVGQADAAGRAVRALLGERVCRLVRGQPGDDGPGGDDDLLRLRLAVEEAAVAAFDAGVLEDWRTVLGLVAARNSRLGAVD